MASIDEKNNLVNLAGYLKAGVHIGTNICTPSMKKYVYKVRSDALYVIDVPKVDERIKMVARFLAKYEPEEIVIVSTKISKGNPVVQFAEFLHSEVFSGKFLPGTFTNPNLTGKHKFIEPKIIIVVNPRNDLQAIKEANMVGIPVISLVDTDNDINGLDLVIPCNNKDKDSVFFIFWALALDYFSVYGKK